MGASNVAAAFALWGHLPDDQMRALAYMALRSLDEPNGKYPARLYFAGREDLAFGLGLEVPTDDDEKARKRRAVVYRIVQRRVAKLVKLGAIERMTKAHTGHRQAYRLNLGLADLVAYAPKVSGTLLDDWVSPQDTHRVSPQDTQLGVSPRRKLGVSPRHP
jgi:hypothetical protein